MTEKPERPLPRDIERELLESLSTEGMPRPPEGLFARIEARIAAESGRVTVRAADVAWKPLCPGVEAKTLYQDAHSRTWLARLAAGATIPAHAHRGDEECTVLEGAVELDGMVLGPADFQIARAGTSHDVVSSKTGCLLLIRTRL